MGAKAASVAKGELRQGDFYSRPRETRAITAGGALAQPKTMSMGGIGAGDSSANDGQTGGAPGRELGVAGVKELLSLEEPRRVA